MRAAHPPVLAWGAGLLPLLPVCLLSVHVLALGSASCRLVSGATDAGVTSEVGEGATLKSCKIQHKYDSPLPCDISVTALGEWGGGGSCVPPYCACSCAISAWSQWRSAC